MGGEQRVHGTHRALVELRVPRQLPVNLERVPVQRLERRLQPREGRVERLAPRQEVLGAERLEGLRVAVGRAPERGGLGDAPLGPGALDSPCFAASASTARAAAGRSALGGGGIAGRAGGVARAMSATTVAAVGSMRGNLTLGGD